VNRFRSKPLRDQYAAMVDAYRSGHQGLFTDAGQPHRASGLALAFWNGFDGVSIVPGPSAVRLPTLAGELAKTAKN
jgi:hypothetical protein